MGGRGASSDIQNIRDWLSGEGNSGSPPKPMDVTKFDGWSLQQTESYLRNLKHEELFVFDAEGKIIAAYKGNNNSVSFPVTLFSEQGATVTHGHPKGMAEFGGTFSWADINNMLKSKWSEHRATASGQGEMNYIMRATSKANPTELRNRINRDFKRIDAKWQKAYLDAFKEQKAAGASDKQAKHVARQKGVGVLNAYYKRIFPQYGYEYVTRKKDYQYNR